MDIELCRLCNKPITGRFQLHAGCQRRYTKDTRWLDRHTELVEKGMEKLASDITHKHSRRITDADRERARAWVQDSGKRTDHGRAAEAAAAVLNGETNLVHWDMMMTSELRMVYLKRLASGLTSGEKRASDYAVGDFDVEKELLTALKAITVPRTSERINQREKASDYAVGR